MAKVITVVDTFGFFFRSFYALPPLKNKDGFPTGLLTGFVNFVNNLYKEHQSDYIVFALDSPGKSFRAKIDENYKANRPEAPEDLKRQLPVAIEWINKMGFKTMSMEGFEADDIIASLAQTAKYDGCLVKVISHDKDLYQLIDDNKVVLVDPIKKTEVTEAKCFEKYGVTPAQFIDYQSIVGDSADNVPGVKGIGAKGAQKLISEFGSLEKVYENLDVAGTKRTMTLLSESRENAFLSKELVTLKRDLVQELKYEEFEFNGENPLNNIFDDLVEYDMYTVINRLNVRQNESPVEEEPKQEAQYILLNSEEELFSVVENIEADVIVALDTETTGLDAKTDELVGFSFALSMDKAYYVPLRHNYLGVEEQVSLEAAKKALQTLFTKNIVGHNLKFDLKFLQSFLQTQELPFLADTMILAWLAEPSKAVGLDKLSQFFFGHEMISYKATTKGLKSFAEVPLEKACDYAAEDALITYKLYFKLLELLKNQDAGHLLSLANELEFPFASNLLEIEEAGVKLDVAYLEGFKKEISTSLEALIAKIHDLAGTSFNINSTKQLGVILFESLGLTAKKKTKTGYSTDEKVLNAIKDEHAIVPAILEYRELFKLFSTYIEPLLKLAKENKEHIIHTSFLQTGTATGRLSSKNPNLQNIPTRSEIGRRIRRAFVAREGKKLVGIDYSQIELRLLAHFSKDSVLVEAFNHGEDIHHATALRLFGEEEAKEKRAIAKTVNFGVLYGMGSKKLSDTLKITTKEAKAIIDKYFESFSSIKEYMQAIEIGAQEDGFVETLLQRRRYFDFENAAPMMLAAFKRESVNTKFQGSAADLIKMAMNKISKLIKEENLPAQMLLQIHDELIFEIDEAKAEELGKRFQTIMEEIYTLNVPLVCSMNISTNWAELK